MVDLIAIFAYIGTAYGLMCIGQTCGLKNPWLSWIPFANVYQLGVVADHYMARNENRETKQRKTLLILNIIMTVFLCIWLVAVVIGVFGIFFDAGVSLLDVYLDPVNFEVQMAEFVSGWSEAEAMEYGVTVLLSFFLPLIALLPIMIVYYIFYYIALHRVFKLMDPKNATIYTVLSIFLNIVPPIAFLMIAKKTPVYPSEGPFFETTAAAFDAGSTGNTSDTDAGSNTYSI